MEAVKACQTTEREPIYESRGATHDGYDFGQTYIEVDLATQHLYFYKDGKVIIDSPFVSGNVSKNYTTPPGLFELYYKQKLTLEISIYGITKKERLSWIPILFLELIQFPIEELHLELII